MEAARRFEQDPVPRPVKEALELVAAWLEADAQTYDRASDAEAAADKREHAAAMRKLAQGHGSDDLRDQAVEFLKMSRIAGWQEAVAALEGMDFPR